MNEDEKNVELTQTDTGNTPVTPIVPNEDKVWQGKLLPFMIASLIALTIFFIVSSYFEFRDFKTRLDPAKNEELLQVMNASGDKMAQDQSLLDGNTPGKIEYVRWRSLVLLERDAINRRYHHSQTIIFSRMWTRYLGFITGMILAIVGAVFVLGKLREEMSEFGGESQGIKVNFKSASPGIILAVLGTILLITTLVVKFDVDVKDGYTISTALLILISGIRNFRIIVTQTFCQATV